MSIQKLLIAAAFCASLSLQSLQAEELSAPQDFTIDLKDPVFTKGVVSTDQGGVISGDGLRIQAQKITYVNRIENGIHIHSIEAEGDLLFQYGDQAFVGKRLEYDLVSRSGTLYEGKTYVDIWYLGGDKIILQSDGRFSIVRGYVTTSESQDHTWELRADKIRISKERMLTARDIRLNFFNFPLFWVPTFCANLKFFHEPPIRYKLTWDRSLGPRISARYRIYSWEDFSLFLRGDYRVRRGGGAALESVYRTEDRRTEFITRSYGSIDDKSVPIQERRNHFRLQGLFRSETQDGRTKAYLTYDKISDEKMIGEFKTDNFEISTQKRTRLFIDHKEVDSFVGIRVQPRINPWQSLNQELPSVTIGLKPFTFGSSGIIMQNWVNASYLDYVYATNLQDFIHNTNSGRLETVNQIYRPIPLRYFTLTPEVGIIAIFYSNSPHHNAARQFVGTYGCLLDTRLTRRYTHFTHQFRPYASFQGITRPTSRVDRHFIFGIDDGINRINALRLGVENNLYQWKKGCDLPTIGADVYTYAFLGNRGELTIFPRLYTDIDLSYPTETTRVGFVWNMQKRVVDRINAQIAWTVSQNLAFTLEMRHRSRFDWRKSDHDNFILDVSRSIHELVQSPISDGRNALLAQIQLRLHPLWTCHFATHMGWGRRNEPMYHSEKIDLYTMVATSWRLRISALFSPADTRFDWGIQLVE